MRGQQGVRTKNIPTEKKKEELSHSRRSFFLPLPSCIVNLKTACQWFDRFVTLANRGRCLGRAHLIETRRSASPQPSGKVAGIAQSRGLSAGQIDQKQSWCAVRRTVPRPRVICSNRRHSRSLVRGKPKHQTPGAVMKKIL